MSWHLSGFEVAPSTVRLVALIVVTTFVSSCASHHIQTTSGKSYLARHQSFETALDVDKTERALPGTEARATFEQALHHVANIEPTLSFPARIGIAKVGCNAGCGKPVPMRPREVEAWSKMAASLGATYGTFVPISPLTYEQALTEAVRTGLDVSSLTAIDKVRLGAARQHLDGVIIYEAKSQSDSEANVLWLADLLIIGAYVLPSRKIEAEAYAAAIMLDPLTGYPYGQAEASAEGDSKYATLAGRSKTKDDMEHAAEFDAVEALAAEVEKAIRDLRSALAERDVRPNT